VLFAGKEIIADFFNKNNGTKGDKGGHSEWTLLIDNKGET